VDEIEYKLRLVLIKWWEQKDIMHKSFSSFEECFSFFLFL